MSTTSLPGTPLRNVIRHELQAIRGKWIWLVALGIALIVLGTILLGFPVVATLATVTVLGALILVGGVVEAVGAFWCREWSGFFLALLSGILGVVVGLMLLGQPHPGRAHPDDPAGELPLRGRHLQGRRGPRAPLRGAGAGCS